MSKFDMSSDAPSSCGSTLIVFGRHVVNLGLSLLVHYAGGLRLPA